MKYTISLDHERKLVLYKHVGRLTREDIDKAWTDFLALKEFTQGSYNLFSDYSEASFDMEMDEAYEIVKILDAMGPVLNGKKQSILINDTYSTAGSILLEQIVQKQLFFKIKVFSTEEAAINWLLN